MAREQRIGLRLSAELRAQVSAVGDVSVVARALLILGLHATGADVSAYIGDASAVLEGMRGSPIAQALEWAMFNKRSTNVQQVTPVTYAGNTGNDHAEPFDDPLAGIGIEV